MVADAASAGLMQQATAQQAQSMLGMKQAAKSDQQVAEMLQESVSRGQQVSSGTNPVEASGGADDSGSATDNGGIGNNGAQDGRGSQIDLQV